MKGFIIMESEQERRILIKYTQGPDYRKIGATGAHGGITPTGHILCNFFIDFKESPSVLEHILRADGTPIPIEVSETQTVIIRELQTGILLSPQIARAIGEWLLRQTNILQEMHTNQSGE